jgi:hypothetical protein
MGQVAFSPQLQQVSRVINAWNLLEKKAKGIRTCSRLLQRSLRKANLSPSVRGLSIKIIQQNLKDAYKAYYKVKGSDKELRASSMEKLAGAIAAAGNIPKEKIIKVIRHREK